ncbi:MAG: polysaccharide deacetylase family protein [Planctomycetota bacterium]|nr:polysaccharide deacetylase family protein [Planctomycetota bacterium]
MTPPARIFLSFDVEEYDLPNEFGADLPLERQMQIGTAGFERTLELLDRLQVPSTLFTTSRFAEHASQLVRDAAGTHEIASHGVRHDRFEPDDFAHSRSQLESISGATVRGFRMPRLQYVDPVRARNAGYQYDSSENPIRLPGRYDNRHLPRTPRIEQELLRVPISTTPRLRIPLFWLGFRHLPGPILDRCLDRTLSADGQLVLFFHPWELLEPQRGLPMPMSVRRGGGLRLEHRLERVMSRLRDQAEFHPMSNLLEHPPE